MKYKLFSLIFFSILLFSIGSGYAEDSLQVSTIIDSSRALNNHMSITITPEEFSKIGYIDNRMIIIMFGVIIALLSLLIYSFYLLRSKLDKVIKKEAKKRKFIELQMKDLTSEYEHMVKTSSENIKESEEQLQKSERRYKHLVQHIQEGMVIVDTDDNFIFANKAALEIFGYSKTELMGKNFKDFIRSSEYKDLEKQNELRKKGESSRYEIVINRPDGAERIIKISASPLIEQNVLVGSIAVFMDITDNTKIQNLHSVLYNITNAINTSVTLKDLYRKIHKDLSIVIDTTNIYIALYDKTTNVISAPYYVDQMNNIPPKPQQLVEGLTQYILKTARPLYLNEDIRNRLMEQGKIPKKTWKAKVWMGVPLMVNNEPIGVLAVQSYSNPKQYLQSDLWILEFVSEQIAIAITKKRAERALQKSEKFNRAIISNSPIGISARDRNGSLIIANRAWMNLWHKTDNDIKEDQMLRDKFEFDNRDEYLDEYKEQVKQIYKYGGELFIPELKIINSKFESEGYRWISQYFYAIKDDYNQVDRVIILTSDITSRKKDQEKLEASLTEKEILLKEVHHRVKNNMQIISSMLKLQAAYIDDKKALELFMDSQNRVKSMALIHEKLYKSENFEKVDFYQYVRVLVNNLIRSLSVDSSKIKLDIKIEDVFLNINKAIPCGLIINELISNVFKHAFDPDQQGIVKILMRKEDNCYHLNLSDNGKGFPNNIDINKTDSLGLQLVSALTNQLHGTIEMQVEDGTAFQLSFPEKVKKFGE